MIQQTKGDSLLEIRHHNIITNAKYDYTKTQQDLFFFLISKLNTNSNNEFVVLPIDELEQITKVRYNYLELKDSINDLMSKTFEIEDDNGFKILNIIQYIEYYKNYRELKIMLSETIKPLLYDLKSNFTSFQLQSAINLKSKYAKRIYTMCSQWKDIGETKHLPLIDLKNKLYIIDDNGYDMYKQIVHFKEKVLDIAVKQINEHTELNISYELIKKVRTFTHIKFYINCEKPKQIHIEFNPQTSDEKLKKEQVIKELASMGITREREVNMILEKLPQYYKFIWDYKNGKKIVKKSLAGLLLKDLGIS